jgi:hypothetical protein
MKTMIVHQLIIIVFSQSNAAAKHTLVTMIVVGYLNNLQRNPQAYGYHCTLSMFLKEIVLRLS